MEISLGVQLSNEVGSVLLSLDIKEPECLGNMPVLKTLPNFMTEFSGLDMGF